VSKGWLIKDKFLVGPKRKAQVQIGPQEFPPPSEEEVQGLIDQLEDAARQVDEVIGFDATLTARYGQEYVDYMNQLSDGLHYLLLQGRRPGPPPGFEIGQPSVEIEPGAIGTPGAPGMGKPSPMGMPGRPEPSPMGGIGRPELGPGRPELGPSPLGRPAARKRPTGQVLAGLQDAVEDLECRINDSMDELTGQIRHAGRDPDSVYALNDAADAARESITRITRLLEGQD